MEEELGISNDYLPMDPKRLLERLHTSLNTRDLTNLLHSMQVDYEQIWPAKPGSDTTGLEAAREYWDQLFTTYPDFQADLVRQAIEGNTIWAEWRWHGTEGGRGGMENRLELAGVVVYGVEEGLIAWSRNYLIDVQQNGSR